MEQVACDPVNDWFRCRAESIGFLVRGERRVADGKSEPPGDWSRLLGKILNRSGRFGDVQRAEILRHLPKL